MLARLASARPPTAPYVHPHPIVTLLPRMNVRVILVHLLFLARKHVSLATYIA